jgi:hypothetical protein
MSGDISDPLNETDEHRIEPTHTLSRSRRLRKVALRTVLNRKRRSVTMSHILAAAFGSAWTECSSETSGAETR